MNPFVTGIQIPCKIEKRRIGAVTQSWSNIDQSRVGFQRNMQEARKNVR